VKGETIPLPGGSLTALAGLGAVRTTKPVAKPPERDRIARDFLLWLSAPCRRPRGRHELTFLQDLFDLDTSIR
jgi:hypothetical protein